MYGLLEREAAVSNKRIRKKKAKRVIAQPLWLDLPPVPQEMLDFEVAYAKLKMDLALYGFGIAHFGRVTVGSTKPGPSRFFCDQNPCTHIDQNGDVMHLKLPTSSGLGNWEK